MNHPDLSLDSQNNESAVLVKLLSQLQQYGYAHTTVTPLTHARVNARPENAWAHDLCGIFGWNRPFDKEVLPAEIFERMQQAGIIERHENGWRSRVRVSSLGRLLFVHSAFPTSEAEAVFFGPDTYRFANAIQQELERKIPFQRAVDIGCGAGPGAVLLALARPEAEVLAVDINDKALVMTQINALHNGAGNLQACRSNLLNDVAGEFDLVIANPPYLVDPTERAYRHGGGPLGAQLAMDIIDAAMQRLAPGGILLLYTGVAIINGSDPFLTAAKKRLEAANTRWSYREMDPDIFGEELAGGCYAQADRIAAVVLRAEKRV